MITDQPENPPLPGRLCDAAALAADASALFAFVVWYNAVLLDQSQYFLIAFYGLPTLYIAMCGIMFAIWSFIVARYGLAEPFDSSYRYPLLINSAFIALGSLLVLIETQDVWYVLCISAVWLAFLNLSTKQMHMSHYEDYNGATAFIYRLLKELRQIAAVAVAVLTVGWCFDIYIHWAAIDAIPLSQLKHLHCSLISAQDALDTKLEVVSFGILIALLGIKYGLRRSKWPDTLGTGLKAVQHVAEVVQIALIVVLTVPVLGMVSGGPLATLQVLITKDHEGFTDLRRDILLSIQKQTLHDMYEQAWRVAPRGVTDKLIVSQDIERRWGLLEQSSGEALRKYHDLFKSPLPADALAPSPVTSPASPDPSAVGEELATWRRLQEAHDSLSKASKAIEEKDSPRWLHGLREDFAKQMLTSGFDVLNHGELLKQIAIDHPFAGMFLDAIKNAGVDSILQAIRPTVDRLAQQSLLEPEVLLPKSIETISQNLANKNGVREASFVSERTNPSKAFADSELELASLLAQLKAAADVADDEYRARYEIRVLNIGEIRADFIRLRDLYGSTGLYDKLDLILEDAFQRLSHEDTFSAGLYDLSFMEKYWPNEVAVILAQHVGATRQLRGSEWARRAYESRIEAARQRHLQEAGVEFRREKREVEIHGK